MVTTNSNDSLYAAFLEENGYWEGIPGAEVFKELFKKIVGNYRPVLQYLIRTPLLTVLEDRSVTVAEGFYESTALQRVAVICDVTEEDMGREIFVLTVHGTLDAIGVSDSGEFKWIGQATPESLYEMLQANEDPFEELFTFFELLLGEYVKVVEKRLGAIKARQTELTDAHQTYTTDQAEKL